MITTPRPLGPNVPCKEATFDLRPEVAHLGHCERICTECEMEDYICRYINGTPGFQYIE